MKTIGTVTKNKGSYSKTHPFKVTITSKEAIKTLKEIHGYQMFAWVFKTEEEAQTSLNKIIEKLKYDL